MVIRKLRQSLMLLMLSGCTIQENGFHCGHNEGALEETKIMNGSSYVNKERIPERSIMNDVTIIEALAELMRWYKTGLSPLEQDISYVLFPLLENGDSTPSGDASLHSNQTREVERRTLDLSGLTLSDAFEKIAKTFGGAVAFRHGVYYIGTDKAIDRLRSEHLASTRPDISDIDADQCDGRTIFSMSWRIVAPHTVCITVRNTSGRNYLVLVGQGHAISYIIGQDDGKGNVSCCKDVALLSERQCEKGRIPLAGTAFDRTDSISDSFSFDASLPFPAAFLQTIRLNMHVVPNIDIRQTAFDAHACDFQSLSITIFCPDNEKEE